MSSVGYAWAKLRGRASGDKEEAAKFLNSMSPQQMAERNRQESKVKSRLKKRKYYRLGSR